MQPTLHKRKPPYGIFIALVVIVISFIIAVWSGVGTFYDNGVPTVLTLNIKVLMTAGALVVVILYSIFFFYQKNKDKKMVEEYSSTTGNGTLETTYKLSGAYGKFRAIGGTIGTILATVASIYFLYKGMRTPEGEGYFVFSAIMFLVALGAAVNSWIYWKRSKSLSKGRFY